LVLIGLPTETAETYIDGILFVHNVICSLQRLFFVIFQIVEKKPDVEATLLQYLRRTCILENNRANIHETELC